MSASCVQLEKGLEDSTRRRAAANAISFFCGSTRLDFQEHVPSLLTVLPQSVLHHMLLVDAGWHRPIFAHSTLCW